MAESWTWVNPRLIDPPSPPPPPLPSGPWALIALKDELEREALGHALGYLEWDVIVVDDLTATLVEAERRIDPPPVALIADATDPLVETDIENQLPNSWKSATKILVRDHLHVVASESTSTTPRVWQTLIRPINLVEVVAVLDPLLSS